MSTGGTTAPPLRMHRAASRDENHEVLRQINIATVLSQGPAFLYDAKGPCEETYDLSEPLEVGSHYDDFVSHTWRTRPNMKWFALLFEYNGALAYKAAHVTGFLVFLLQLLAPHLERDRQRDQHHHDHQRPLQVEPRRVAVPMQLAPVVLGGVLGCVLFDVLGAVLGAGLPMRRRVRQRQAAAGGRNGLHGPKT